MPALQAPLLLVWLALAALAAAGPARAQAQASTPAPVLLSHDSVLARYKRFEDASTAPWRDANDTVGRIGGWRVYAREQTPPASPSPSPAPPALGPGAGHEGHHRPAQP